MNLLRILFPASLRRAAFCCLAVLVVGGASSAASADGVKGFPRKAFVSSVVNLDEDTIRVLLAQCLTTANFQLMNWDVVVGYRQQAKQQGWDALIKASKWKPPEYEFRASYETGLEGPVKSRMWIGLYFYNGESLKEWKTESPSPTVTLGWHKKSMFTNPDALVRQSKPLEELLWNFEKTPFKCAIRLAKQVIPEGEEIEIGDFQDTAGQASREFNRIIVTAGEGQILGGTESRFNPDYKVFPVGDGRVKVRYRAPHGGNEPEKDLIRIYNSPDILSKEEYPLSETELREVIGEAKLDICYGGWSGSISIDFQETFTCKIDTTDTDPRYLQESSRRQGKVTVHIRKGRMETGELTSYGSTEHSVDDRYEFGIKHKDIDTRSSDTVNRDTHKETFRCPLKSEEVDFRCNPIPGPQEEPGSYPVQLLLVISPKGMAEVSTSSYIESYERGTGKRTVERDEHVSLKKPPAMPRAFIFKGTYIKTKDSRDRIVSTDLQQETGSPEKKFNDRACPGRRFVRTHRVDLTKHPETKKG